MNNIYDEHSFLSKIKENSEIIYLNKSRFDVRTLINNLEVVDPPDYVYGNHIIEKFGVDAYERVLTRKNKKKSLHLQHENEIHKLENQGDELFSAEYYSAPDSRTHTSYLKNNLLDMIEVKVKKREGYLKKIPNAKYSSLIIEVKNEIDLYVDSNGNFIDRKVNTNNLDKVKYMLCKDLRLISKIKSIYSSKLDFLLFVHEIGLAQKYTIYCIDLTNELIEDNMIIYPDKLLQIRIGSLNSVRMIGKTNSINVKYKCNIDLHECDCEEIFLYGVKLTKSNRYSSIYVSDDEVISFQMNRLYLALNYKKEKKDFRNYIPLLCQASLKIKIANEIYNLNRITQSTEYIILREDKVYLKVNDTRIECFKLFPFEQKFIEECLVKKQ